MNDGVPIRVLRRIAFYVVGIGAVGLAVAGRTAGANAVFAAVFAILVYGTLVTVPIQMLYRDARLRPAGVALFALTVLTILAAFWCAPLVRNEVSDDPTYVVPLRGAFGKPDLTAGGLGGWESATYGFAALTILCCIGLALVARRMQELTRGHAVNPAMAGSVLASFATLPAPQGGTGVTRPAVAPRTRRAGRIGAGR